MITLFIDTNVLLSFYYLTSEDIEELKKLVALVKNKEISLIVPKQVEDEFWRNRGGKISDAMKKLRRPNSMRPSRHSRRTTRNTMSFARCSRRPTSCMLSWSARSWPMRRILLLRQMRS